MTTTELIELLKKHERGGATGRPREVMFEVDDRIINTDGIEVTGSGDGLIAELYLSLPSAQPEPRWIPCSERLPEANGNYLVTGRQGAVNKRKFEDGRWYGNWAVTAWMPLPARYKEDADD